MTIPKLVFAESALWLFLPHLKARQILKAKYSFHLAWKDEYFVTDPATDYNN